MLPEDFHPVLRQWWQSRFGAPTPAQLEGWRAIRRGEDTLIAAPTGSGKTLAAFLTAIDQLLCEGLETGGLADEVRVIYVSPLKALSADIHKNLAVPRREIHSLSPIKITAAVRSGDTPQNERAAMLRTPPHILVTTPESLYLLLTAERSRQMLRTARTVIVDEIHAVIGTGRGAHFALTLERLQEVAEQPLLRIGLSATQKPIAEVARFLVGAPSAVGDPQSLIREPQSGLREPHAALSPSTVRLGSPSTLSLPNGSRGEIRNPECSIVDEGHRREMDLGMEIPGSTLDAVMSHDVWEEYFNRIAELIGQHK